LSFNISLFEFIILKIYGQQSAHIVTASTSEAIMQWLTRTEREEGHRISALQANG
jgi:hypothetical protein